MAKTSGTGTKKDEVKVVTNPSGAVVATNVKTGKVVIVQPPKK